MSISGAGEIADLIKDGLDKIWPDKSEAEKQQATILLTSLQGQLNIDTAEAQSADPLQHWRGGMGWVCVAGYGWNFVLQPLIATISTAYGHPITLSPLDIGPLATLTLGMLGLGGLHVAERMKGVGG